MNGHRTPSRGLAALRYLLVLALVGCGRMCGGDAPVAHVASASGLVQRDRVASLREWEPAAAQAAITLGEGIKTGEDGQAELGLVHGGALRMGPSSLVRFGGEVDNAEVQVEAGGVEIEAGDAEIEFLTELGQITLEAGGRIGLTHTDFGTRLEVIQGSIEMEAVGPARRNRGAVAGPIELSVGDVFSDYDAGPREPAVPDAGSADLGPRDLGAAVVDLGVRDQGQGSPDLGGQGEETEASGETAQAEGAEIDDELDAAEETWPLGARIPAVSGHHFTVGAGSGGVVHHPSPPAIIGIRTGCDGAEVGVRGPGGARTYVGSGTVGIQLDRGRSRYEVRCPGQEPRAGRFSVSADSGRRRLNTTSHRHTVDADGRRYTFLYEGAKPTLTLRWREAPEAESYNVSLTGARRRSMSSRRPVVVLRPRHLRDGELSFQFTADGRTSRRTRVVIRYDTATPTAYLATPGDRGFGAGASVTVSGTAQPGARVSVGGTTLEVDSRGRFSGTASAGGGGLAVRIASPRGGVHYFVRRASGG